MVRGRDVARRMRVAGADGEWTAELGASGVTLSGVGAPFVVSDEGDGRFGITGVGAAAAHAVAAAASRDVVWVAIEGAVFEFRVTEDAGDARASTSDQDALSPPMSATVVRVAVRPGTTVAAGDTLLVLEAMKMELPIRAPRAGVIRAIHCQEGDLVQPGTVLVEM